jgi:hypothetical protein
MPVKLDIAAPEEVYLSQDRSEARSDEATYRMRSIKSAASNRTGRSRVGREAAPASMKRGRKR